MELSYNRKPMVYHWSDYSSCKIGFIILGVLVKDSNIVSNQVVHFSEGSKYPTPYTEHIKQSIPKWSC